MNATTPREKFHAAIDQQDIWKPGEMRDFAIALVSAAVLKLKAGQIHFTTDDVAEEKHPQSAGIAGSVIEKLKNASVIQAVGVTHAGKWYADRVRSTRPTSKGRWIGKYELCSLHNGSEFLARNAVEIAGQQLQFAPVAGH
jgi:RNase P/RNase MRP subunit p29